MWQSGHCTVWLSQTQGRLVEGLGGKQTVHVAVGALHCLVVTDSGQVCRGTGRQEDSTCSSGGTCTV